MSRFLRLLVTGESKRPQVVLLELVALSEHTASSKRNLDLAPLKQTLPLAWQSIFATFTLLLLIDAFTVCDVPTFLSLYSPFFVTST